MCWFRTCARYESRHVQASGAAIVASCRSVAQQSCRWWSRAEPRPKQPGSTRSRSRRCRAGWPATGLRATPLSRARSRRPRTAPAAIPDETVELVVNLRAELSAQGLDAGPHTISWHLQQRHQITVSPSTIRRRLVERGLVEPNPKKRPRSSYVRFQADLPNQMWQSDFTHWPLSDGSTTEIIHLARRLLPLRPVGHRASAHNRTDRRRHLQPNLC